MGHDSQTVYFTSLAHVARSRRLRAAFWCLLSLGASMMFWHAVDLAGAPQKVDENLRRAAQAPAAQRRPPDPQHVARERTRQLRSLRLAHAVGIAAGATYVALAFLVRRRPLGATIAAIALYLATTITFAWLDLDLVVREGLRGLFEAGVLVAAIAAAIAELRARRPASAVPAMTPARPAPAPPAVRTAWHPDLERLPVDGELPVSARPGWPLGALAWAVIALVVVALVAGTGHPDAILLAVPFAFLPACLAVALALVRRDRFEARFAPDGLVLGRDQQVIPYASIRSIAVPQPWRRGRWRPFPIAVTHTDGVLHIPARLNVPSREVLEQLLTRVGLGTPGLPARPDLHDFWLAAGGESSPGSVLTFTGLPRGGHPRTPTVPRLCRAMLVTAAFWSALGLGVDGPIGLVAGAPLALLALIILGFSRLPPSGTNERTRREAALVVAPAGLGLILPSGDHGVLPWSHLSGVRTRDLDLQLVLNGARVTVPDVFDRPLEVIHRAIRWMHQGSWPCPACGTELKDHPGPRCPACRLTVAPPPGRGPTVSGPAA